MSFKFQTIFYFLFVFLSCQFKHIENKIDGEWIVYEVLYKNKIIKREFNLNYMVLSENKNCDVPIGWREPNKFGQGIWYLQNKDTSTFIIFDVGSKFYKDTFRIDKIDNNYLEFSTDVKKVKCSRPVISPPYH